MDGRAQTADELPPELVARFEASRDARRAGDLGAALAALDGIAAAHADSAPVLARLGAALMQLGASDQALPVLERAAELAPERFDVHINLGAAQRAQADHRAAATSFRRASELRPQHAGAWSNLGLALRDAEDLDGAEDALRRAVSLDAGWVGGWSNLGSLLAARLDYEGAMEAFARGLATSTQVPELLLNTGRCQLKLLRFDDALATFRRAAELAPEEAGAWSGMAEVLLNQREFEQAEGAFRRAVALEPEEVGHRLNLGHALMDCNRVGDALAEFLALVEEDAGSEDGHLALASCYERLNRLEQSRAALDAVAVAAAGRKEFVLVDAKLRRRDGRAAEAIPALEALLAEEQDPAWRGTLSFELARCYEAERDAQPAYAAFVAGNDGARIAWDAARPGPNRFLSDLQAAHRGLSDEAVAAWSELSAAPDDGIRAPHFITGFARSGTTLLEQILDAHPGAQVMDERPLIAQLRLELTRRGDGDHLRALASLTEAERGELRAWYREHLAEEIEYDPSLLLVDKLPMANANAHMIHRLFPEARIIQAVRHPCDVVLSCFMQEFGLNAAMANFFSLEDAVTMYEASWRFWDRVSALWEVPHLIHRYEDLVADTEAVARRALEFLGLPWDDAVLDHAGHALRRGRINTPSYSQVSQPIYAHARYRWHRYRPQLEPFLDRLAPFALAFGYPDPREDAA